MTAAVIEVACAVCCSLLVLMFGKGDSASIGALSIGNPDLGRDVLASLHAANSRDARPDPLLSLQRDTGGHGQAHFAQAPPIVAVYEAKPPGTKNSAQNVLDVLEGIPMKTFHTTPRPLPFHKRPEQQPAAGGKPNPVQVQLGKIPARVPGTAKHNSAVHLDVVPIAGSILQRRRVNRLFFKPYTTHQMLPAIEEPPSWDTDTKPISAPAQSGATGTIGQGPPPSAGGDIYSDQDVAPVAAGADGDVPIPVPVVDDGTPGLGSEDASSFQPCIMFPSNPPDVGEVRQPVRLVPLPSSGDDDPFFTQPAAAVTEATANEDEPIGIPEAAGPTTNDNTGSNGDNADDNDSDDDNDDDNDATSGNSQQPIDPPPTDDDDQQSIDSDPVLCSSSSSSSSSN